MASYANGPAALTLRIEGEIIVLDVGEMLEQAAPALAQQHEYPVEAQVWVETWLPQIVNEIERLRNEVVLKDTRILELESEVEALS